jgi:hypothetical protein
MTAELRAKNWRTAFAVLLCLSAAVVALLVYTIVDQAVSLTYMNEGYRNTEAALSNLATIAPLLSESSTQADVVYLLRRSWPDSFIVEKEDTVSGAGLRFRFSDSGALVEISRGW